MYAKKVKLEKRIKQWCILFSHLIIILFYLLFKTDLNYVLRKCLQKKEMNYEVHNKKLVDLEYVNDICLLSNIIKDIKNDKRKTNIWNAIKCLVIDIKQRFKVRIFNNNVKTDVRPELRQRKKSKYLYIKARGKS